ncbi:MAG: glycosyltransferase family 4 protein [candidate division KSB1 bacterium]|nr:glycosyltransferase family 4 protein [candidate division KSB1 bacterium]
MCEAFAKHGAEVLLLAPHYHDMPPTDRNEICHFYDVEPLFLMRQIPSLMSLSKPIADGRRKLRVPWVGGLSLYCSMQREAKSLLKNRDDLTVVYSRSLNGSLAFLQARRGQANPYKVIVEVHAVREQKPFKRFLSVLRAADGLVVISNAVRQELLERFGIPERKMLLAPSAVSAALFAEQIGPQEARRRLRLPEMPTVLYAGQLFPEKGADLLIEAAAFLPPAIHTVIVGGHGAYLDTLRQKAKAMHLTNVTLTGFVPPAQVPLYLAAADVLVLPTRQDHINSDYTSPLKLFEYMASKRPIVCSDLPVLRDILRDGENALFFRSGDTSDLAAAIQRLLNDTDFGRRLAQQAYADVQEFTWEKRAEKILYFIRSL